MANISAVLDEEGAQWLSGYKPARNVSVNVKGATHSHPSRRRPPVGTRYPRHSGESLMKRLFVRLANFCLLTATPTLLRDSHWASLGDSGERILDAHRYFSGQARKVAFPEWSRRTSKNEASPFETVAHDLVQMVVIDLAADRTGGNPLVLTTFHGCLLGSAVVGLDRDHRRES